MADPKIKMTFAELALLDWLCEPGQARRIFTVHPLLSGSSQMYFYELSELGENGKQSISMIQNRERLDQLRMRFGRENFSTMNLIRAKFLSHWHSLSHRSHGSDGAKSSYDKLIDRFDRNPFHYSDGIHAINKDGYQYWKDIGRNEYELQLEQQRLSREAVGRTVVIGARARIYLTMDAEMRRAFPAGFPVPLPTRTYRRAFATAEVVKETANRFYLTNVQRLPGGDVQWGDDPIEGKEPNCYIPRDAVLLDHASPAAVRALQDIDAEFIDSQTQAMRKTYDELLPILQALDSRLAQQVAQREDMVREALARYGQPDEKPDEDTAPKP